MSPYFGPVADFPLRQPGHQYLPLPLRYISPSLSCCRSTLRPLHCCFWTLSSPLRWIGLWAVAGINTIATLPVALLRPADLHRVRAMRDAREGGIPSFDPLRLAPISALPGNDGGGTPLPVFHVGVPVLGAVVPYARPTGREQCCYGGLHLAACAAVHH